MSSEGLLQARELKNRMERIEVKEQYRWVKISHINRARDIVTEIEMSGLVDEDELTLLGELLWKVKQCAQTMLN